MKTVNARNNSLRRFTRSEDLDTKYVNPNYFLGPDFFKNNGFNADELNRMYRKKWSKMQTKG